MTEFLSLCDVLFNVVSLAGYFCDVVFDVVLSYALFERGHFAYMTFVIVVVIASLAISQVNLCGSIPFGNGNPHNIHTTYICEQRTSNIEH